MPVKYARLIIFLASVPIVLAATGLWVFLGWQIGSAPAPPSLLGGFPWKGVGALAAVALLLALLHVMGIAAFTSRLASRLAQPLTMAALNFLATAAFVSAALGFLAFIYIGYYGLLVLGLVCIVLSYGHWRKGSFSFSRRNGPQHQSSFHIESWLALPFLLAAGLAAMAPAVESDGLRYHLAGPEAWLRAGHFVPLPYNANSNLPALQGLLAATLGQGGTLLGRVYQLIHFVHFCALAVVCMELSRAVFRSFAACGRTRAPGEHAARALGALFAVGVPAAAIVAAWPFADVAALAYLLAGVLVLAPGTIKRRPVRLAIGSLILGAAVATKISILPLAGIVGFWGLAQVFRAPRRGMALNIAWLIIPGALVLAPWLIKNIAYHGNPVYPLGYGMFGGEEWSEANQVFYTSKLREKGFGRDAVNLIRSPFDITVHWARFEGQNPGPALLALLPFALVGCLYIAVRRRAWAVLLALPSVLFAILAVGWIVWFQTYQSVRFLLPQIYAGFLLAVPFLVYTAGGIGPAHLRVMRSALALVAIAGALWAPVYRLGTSHVYRASLGFVGEDVYIARRFNAYPAIQWLNANTEKNEPVFYIGEHRAAYADYRPVASDWFDTPRILVEIRRTENNDALLRDWREQGIRYVLMNLAELRLYEAAFFKPRFTDQEWKRFVELRARLLENVVFDSQAGVYIQGTGGVPPALP